MWRSPIGADVKGYAPGRDVGCKFDKRDGVRRNEERRNFRIIDGAIVMPGAGRALLVSVESGRVMMMHRRE